MATPPKDKKDLKPVGRPTKYCRKLVEKILTSIRNGLYMEASAAIVNINKDTLYLWLKQYPEFSDSVLKAHAEAEQIELGRIKQAAEGYEVVETKITTDKKGNVTETVVKTSRRREWTASAWWLERTNSRKWGRYHRDDMDSGDNHIEVVRRKPYGRIIEAVDDGNGSDNGNGSASHDGNGHG